MKTVPYNRIKAIQYAKEYALKRNPKYMDFEKIGGDCTNFCSQCLYAGSGVMNYKKDIGWYYISPSKRAPAWSGVRFLNTFLTTNKGVGPFAQKVPISQIEAGDIIQLGDSTGRFYHSLFVNFVDGVPSLDTIYVSTHSMDSYNRPLNSYEFDQMRCLHILGVHKQ